MERPDRGGVHFRWAGAGTAAPERIDDDRPLVAEHDERPLGEAEGAFLLCGYVMALALDQQGEAVGAARWFERGRAACGPPGLFSEEFDVCQRQLRATCPRPSHALMLEYAARLRPG